MRRTRYWLALASLALFAGCGDDGPLLPPQPSRSYIMGFTGIPPRPETAAVLATIALWSQRADAALILHEPPWDSLLAGRPAPALVRRDQLGLANYYRALGLQLVVSIDPTNGLARASDAAALVAAGRSLVEPAIQQLFRDYVTTVDTILHPTHLFVASETNLVRAVAPPALYDGLVLAASAAANAVRAHDTSVQLGASVQVETAWGRLASSGGYTGIAPDRVDFAFAQVLGLSSYPYLGGFTTPDSIPDDYYARLANDAVLPVMVIEGGWASESIGAVVSSLELQRRYIVRHIQILDAANAAGVFQLTFTDLDLDALMLPPGSILPYFARLGLVDMNLQPKPALAVWDVAFARRRSVPY